MVSCSRAAHGVVRERSIYTEAEGRPTVERMEVRMLELSLIHI